MRIGSVGCCIDVCSSTGPYLITHAARETCVNRPRLVVVLSPPDPSSYDFYTILYGAELRNAISYCTCESLLMLYLLWHNINVMCAHGSRYTCVCIIRLIYIYIHTKTANAHKERRRARARARRAATGGHSYANAVNWNVFARQIEFIFLIFHVVFRRLYLQFGWPIFPV